MKHNKTKLIERKLYDFYKKKLADKKNTKNY